MIDEVCTEPSQSPDPPTVHRDNWEQDYTELIVICHHLMIDEVCTEPSQSPDPHYCTLWQLGTRLHQVIV